ncbi:hypothetical protein I0C85_20375 [Escherichia coli]|uniref:hypothetical protein n=2 Tax=Escherichia coli TaxID=562 RepID=UPI0018A2D5AD|nr:hypothetical protein [Escherichia coli]MBF7889480.1 hypothetical protein [Escherichia coli]MCM5808705.1 hypothetical protein [Escherichia coli]
MWQINEVVLFDNDPYRILAIEDGQVVWMQISADKGVPQARAELLLMQYLDEGRLVREGANKQVISSQADSLIKISRIWADFFPANTSNQPI